MFGQCCFDTGDIKVTMGTGTFWDINTGNNIHVSKKGRFVCFWLARTIVDIAKYLP